MRNTKKNHTSTNNSSEGVKPSQLNVANDNPIALKEKYQQSKTLGDVFMTYICQTGESFIIEPEQFGHIYDTYMIAQSAIDSR